MLSMLLQPKAQLQYVSIKPGNRVKASPDLFQRQQNPQNLNSSLYCCGFTGVSTGPFLAPRTWRCVITMRLPDTQWTIQQVLLLPVKKQFHHITPCKTTTCRFYTLVICNTQAITCSLVSLRGTGRYILSPLDRVRLAVPLCLFTKLT